MFIVEFFFDKTYSLDSEITFIMPFLILEEDVEVDAEEKNQVFEEKIKKSKTELVQLSLIHI